jgi:hypothetical protein
MEVFREERASKHHERGLYIHIKEMHTHIGETGWKEKRRIA